MGLKNWHHVKNSSVNLAIFCLLCSRNLTNTKKQHNQFKNQTYWSHSNTLLIRTSISLAEKFLDLKGRFSLSLYCMEIFSTLTAVLYFWTHLLWSVIKYMLKWRLSSVKLIGHSKLTWWQKQKYSLYKVKKYHKRWFFVNYLANEYVSSTIILRNSVLVCGQCILFYLWWKDVRYTPLTRIRKVTMLQLVK